MKKLMRFCILMPIALLGLLSTVLAQSGGSTHFSVQQSVTGSSLDNGTMDQATTKRLGDLLNSMNYSAAIPLSYNVAWSPDGIASFSGGGNQCVSVNQAVSLSLSGSLIFVNSEASVVQDRTTKFELVIAQNGDNTTATIKVLYTITNVDTNGQLVHSTGTFILGYINRKEPDKISKPSPFILAPTTPSTGIKFKIGGSFNSSSGYYETGRYRYETWDGTTLTSCTVSYQYWVDTTSIINEQFMA